MTSECPECGGNVATYASRRVGSFIRRYRCCDGCEYADVALVRPEEVVRIRVRYKTTDPPKEGNHVQE